MKYWNAFWDIAPDIACFLFFVVAPIYIVATALIHFFAGHLAVALTAGVVLAIFWLRK